MATPRPLWLQIKMGPRVPRKFWLPVSTGKRHSFWFHPPSLRRVDTDPWASDQGRERNYTVITQAKTRQLNKEAWNGSRDKSVSRIGCVCCCFKGSIRLSLRGYTWAEACTQCFFSMADGRQSTECRLDWGTSYSNPLSPYISTATVSKAGLTSKSMSVKKS